MQKLSLLRLARLIAVGGAWQLSRGRYETLPYISLQKTFIVWALGLSTIALHGTVYTEIK